MATVRDDPTDQSALEEVCEGIRSMEGGGDKRHPVPRLPLSLPRSSVTPGSTVGQGRVAATSRGSRFLPCRSPQLIKSSPHFTPAALFSLLHPSSPSPRLYPFSPPYQPCHSGQTTSPLEPQTGYLSRARDHDSTLLRFDGTDQRHRSTDPSMQPCDFQDTVPRTDSHR